MVTTITVDGQSTTNIADFSVQEDATPIRGGDNSGGVGSISVTVAEENNTIRVLFEEIELADTYNGETKGIINALSGDEFAASLDGDSQLVLLVNEVTALPYIGTLGDAIRYYLSLGSVSAEIFIDPITDVLPVAFVGWTDILWDQIKSICTAFQIEVSLVAGTIVVRQIRGRVGENATNADVSWSLDISSLAQQFTVKNYNLEAVSNRLAYPHPDKIEEASTISVDAGELLVVDLQTDISLLSIVQPQISQGFPKYYDGPLSLYSVMDSNGAQLGAEEWARIGGSLTAEISPTDPSTIVLTVRGGTTPERAPYKIALIDGGEEVTTTFAALRIVGSGVAFFEEDIVIPTGVPANMSGDSTGPTVDNIFIGSAGKAFELAYNSTPSYAGPQYEISVTTAYVNRRGESGALSFTSYEEFEELSGDETYAEFEIEWNGKTYTDFLEFYYDLTANTFENQAFGNVSGARILYRNCWFRIRSATITQDSIVYTAESDTIYSDFALAWDDGASYADFEAQWGTDHSYADFGVTPLWRT